MRSRMPTCWIRKNEVLLDKIMNTEGEKKTKLE